MNRRIVDWYMAKTKDIERTDIEKSRVWYGLMVILSETEKTILLVVIFAIAGRLPEFIVDYIAAISVREYIGGRHMTTWLGCMLYTTMFFAAAVCLQVLCPMPVWLGYLSIIMGAVLMWLYAPIPSKARPEGTYNDSQKLRIKKRGMLSLVICMVLLTAARIISLDMVVSGIGWSVFLVNMDAISEIFVCGGERYDEEVDKCNR